MNSDDSYSLIDSGNGRKLEKFGRYLISRPCAQAVWQPHLTDSEWAKSDAYFSREHGNEWIVRNPLPETWTIDVAGIRFQLSSTDFGHLGIFPEQDEFWSWIQSFLEGKKRQPQILNLFAYSGGATLAAAKAGASLCHLDASKGMVAWARDNATLNGLEKAPIRWIVDDVTKFLARELKRGNRYDGIILDPPTFGRGTKSEIFKIEEQIVPLLNSCRLLLTEKPIFVLFSCHTPGFTPIVMDHLLTQTMNGLKGHLSVGEMTLKGSPQVFPIPSGTFAKWVSDAD